MTEYEQMLGRVVGGYVFSGVRWKTVLEPAPNTTYRFQVYNPVVVKHPQTGLRKLLFIGGPAAEASLHIADIDEDLRVGDIEVLSAHDDPRLPADWGYWYDFNAVWAPWDNGFTVVGSNSSYLAFMRFDEDWGFVGVSTLTPTGAPSPKLGKVALLRIGSPHSKSFYAFWGGDAEIRRFYMSDITAPAEEEVGAIPLGRLVSFNMDICFAGSSNPVMLVEGWIPYSEVMGIYLVPLFVSRAVTPALVGGAVTEPPLLSARQTGFRESGFGQPHLDLEAFGRYVLFLARFRTQGTALWNYAIEAVEFGEDPLNLSRFQRSWALWDGDAPVTVPVPTWFAERCYLIPIRGFSATPVSVYKWMQPGYRYGTFDYTLTTPTEQEVSPVPNFLQVDIATGTKLYLGIDLKHRM